MKKLSQILFQPESQRAWKPLRPLFCSLCLVSSVCSLDSRVDVPIYNTVEGPPEKPETRSRRCIPNQPSGAALTNLCSFSFLPNPLESPKFSVLCPPRPRIALSVEQCVCCLWPLEPTREEKEWREGPSIKILSSHIQNNPSKTTCFREHKQLERTSEERQPTRTRPPNRSAQKKALRPKNNNNNKQEVRNEDNN